ncbi:hypothetical protein ACFQZR_05325 [Paenibacillus sp. GCM10027629]|uniref:hypothetical protein n=1 Tax=Paenibacillus sp. GCM10027629 TaxID=3273414 RepID=UPI003644E185
MMKSTTIRICTLVMLSFALTAGAGLSTVEAKAVSSAASSQINGKFTQASIIGVWIH